MRGGLRAVRLQPPVGVLLALPATQGGTGVSDEKHVIDALDDNRWREIRHEALLGANLWLALCLAAERGDRAATNHACEQIRTLTKATFALVKTLGSAEVANG